ncbi:hypothetical protein N7468_002292 [Penicillium chermesinum]|uniref:Uncharacterized protein n=1 Tax=Penicillium chermesinum TaxID=63820 RepID=A0A9W9PI74_9EURO|nr:uncharacterized protein N7468_002292 [Penicillium chermesinum]KAJ5247309.1 hypothetical protein N7468_002292 [Penicillium chermesinum]
MTADSYYNENTFQPSYDLDASDQYSQYAPTPGYPGRTPMSRYELSPSPGYTQNDLGELCQYHPKNPRILQLSEWDDEIPSGELPASYIRYTIEWKVMVNKRIISQNTEEDIALTPSAYWSTTLRRKLEKLLEGKAFRKGRVRSDDTSIVVSVNNLFQRNLTRRFDNLDIDWAGVENKLLMLAELFRRGKKLRLSITFKYVEDDHCTMHVT